MATDNLSIRIEGIDRLSDTLKKVQGAITSLDQSLDRLQNAFSGITQSSNVAESQLSDFGRANVKSLGSSRALGQSVESTANSLQKEGVAAKVNASTKGDLSRSNTKAAMSARALAGSLDESTEEALTNYLALRQNRKGTSKLSRATGKLAGMLGISTGAFSANTLAAKTNRREHRRLADAIQETSVSLGALSVNVGAFTIALRDMATQVPILLTSGGTLVSVLGAIAAAAITAGGALTGMLGGGLISMADEYAESLEDIENRVEALGEIMSRMGDMFEEALDPLITAQNADLFISFMEDLASVVGAVANAIDYMRDDLVDFFGVVGGHFMDELPNMIATFGNAFYEMEEILVSVSKSIISSIAPAIEYFVYITQKMQDSGGNLLSSLKGAIVAIIEFGTTISDGLLPIFAQLLDMFTYILDILNSFDKDVVALVGTVLGLVAGLKLVSRALVTLSKPIEQLASSMNAVFFETNTATEALRAFGRGGKDAFDTLFEGFGAMKSALGGFSPILTSVSGTFDRTLTSIGGSLTSVSETANAVTSTIIGNFRSMASGIATAVGSSVLHISGLGHVMGSAIEDPGIARIFEKSIFPTFADIKNSANSASQAIKGFGSTLSQGLQSVIGTGPIEFGKGLFQGIDQMNNAYRDIRGQTASVKNAIISHWNEGAAGMGRAVRTMMSGKDELVQGLSVIISQSYASMRASLAHAKAEWLTAGGLRAKASAAWGAVAGLVAQAAAGIKSTVVAIAHSAAEFLTIQGLRGKAAAAWAAVTGLLAQAAATVTATVAAIGLNAALGGLPLLIGAVVTAGAALVGVVGNLGGKTSAWQKSSAAVKNVLSAIVEITVKSLIPVWNMLVDLFEMFYNIAMGIVDPFIDTAKSMGLISDEAGSAGGILAGLWDIIKRIGAVGARLINALGGAFSKTGKILYTALYIPIRAILIAFEMLVATGLTVYDVIMAIINGIPFMSQLMDGFAEGIRGAVDAAIILYDAFMWIVGKIQDAWDWMVGRIIDDINFLIESLNKLDRFDIDPIETGEDGDGGARDWSSAKVAYEDFEDESEEDEDEMPQEPAPELEFNDITENHMHGDFNMAPEEEERIKRLVDDALTEANEFRRRREGHTG